MLTFSKVKNKGDQIVTKKSSVKECEKNSLLDSSVKCKVGVTDP